jgi:hypothetical protein
MDSGAISLASLCYNVLKDFARWASCRKKSLSPVELLQTRQKQKVEIESHWEQACDGDGFGFVIIRDIKRMDLYPDKDDGKAPSPWFPGRLLDMYDGRGLRVELISGGRMRGLKYEQEKEGWRFCDYKNGEMPERHAHRVGIIPFERIAQIDWAGDANYPYPHIYCHFTNNNKEPYEEVILCERISFDEGVSYLEIAKYNHVDKLSKKVKKRGFMRFLPTRELP